MYEVRTPEIERNISIDTYRWDGRYHPHSEHMGGRHGVSMDDVVLVVLILLLLLLMIPYGTDRQRVGSNLLIAAKGRNGVFLEWGIFLL
jgi:uncharacterized membrane protein